MIIEELKKKYSDIEEYTLESGDWEDQGVEAFKNENYALAIENFEKVIVAIPDHYNGWEMCSYALYENGEKEKAVSYLEKGIEAARAFEGEAKLPEEMIEDMEKSLTAMREDKVLDQKYIDEIME